MSYKIPDGGVTCMTDGEHDKMGCFTLSQVYHLHFQREESYGSENHFLLHITT